MLVTSVSGAPFCMRVKESSSSSSSRSSRSLQQSGSTVVQRRGPRLGGPLAMLNPDAGGPPYTHSKLLPVAFLPA
ncbi:hypothetical protein Emed_006142 [Eimeria media]